MTYAVVFKRIGASNWQGASITKKGVTLAQVKSYLRKNKKRGYIVKIMSLASFRKLMGRLKSQRRSSRKKVRRNRHMKHR